MIDVFGANGTRLAGAPRLRAAYLIRSGRAARRRLRGVVLIAAGIAVLAALLLSELESAARMLAWLRQHIIAATILAAVAGTAMTARRRGLMRAEFKSSWLAALPIRRAAARWESLIIDMAPAAAAVAALAVIFLAAAIALAFVPGSSGISAVSVCAAMSAGVIGGAIFSYAIPAPKPIDLPPGSRYVPHRRPRRFSALRPSLKALGYWPVRQMFARAQPRMVSRATLPLLVMMPLGTMADTAMVVIGLFLTTGALSLLIPSAISVSVQLRRWVAPLPVRAGRVLRAYLVPSLAVIAGASALDAWLLIVVGKSIPAAAAIGLCLAVLGISLTLGGIWLSRASGASPEA